MPLGDKYPGIPRPKRSRNPRNGRYRNVSWTPDDDVIVRECIENWLIPIDKERILKRGAPSLVSRAGRGLLREFLLWAKENKPDQEEFFKSTQYGQVVRWFRDLQLKPIGEYAKKVEHEIYGKDESGDV